MWPEKHRTSDDKLRFGVLGIEIGAKARIGFKKAKGPLPNIIQYLTTS